MADQKKPDHDETPESAQTPGAAVDPDKETPPAKTDASEADTPAVLGEPDESPEADEPVAEGAGGDDESLLPEADETDVERDMPVLPPLDTPERPEVAMSEPAEAATTLSSEPMVVERRGGFGAALLGGAIAAVLGFVAGRTEILDPLLPPSWQSENASEAIAGLEQKLAAQSDDLSALQSELAAIPRPDTADLGNRLQQIADSVEPLSGQVGTFDGRIATLETRLNELEKRPLGENVAQDAIDAYEQELGKLRDAVATQRSEVEALIAEARQHDETAAEAARVASAQATLARLQTALDQGAPFEDLGTELAGLGVTLPPPLQEVAGSGVPTLAALQAAFPPAARDALAAARARSAGGSDSFAAFFQRQLGARSVEPRAGDDPDAILSRAEAALTGGDLDTAISEVAALTGPAADAMQDWTTEARKRQAALDAAAALAQSVTPR